MKCQYETLLWTASRSRDHGTVHHQLLGNAQLFRMIARGIQLAAHGVTDINQSAFELIELSERCRGMAIAFAN